LKKSLIAIAVLVAAALAAYFLFIRDGGKDEAGYETAEVVRGDVTSYVSATGTANPKVSVLVGTEVSGTIKEIFVEENDDVKTGELLLRLDRELLESRLTQSKAALEAIEAAHAELVAERASVAAEVETGIQRAKAEYAEADARLMRGKGLFDKGFISREDLDALMREQAVKKAVYDQSVAGKARLAAYESRIDAAVSRANEARAGLDTARTNLDKSEITAPMDGVVITRNVDVGQTVAASFNTPELFEIGDLTVMEVEVSVDEADVGRVAVGMDVEFTVDAYPGEVFRGRVSRLSYSPEIVQNVVTYTGIIEVGNAELKLRPGMTANVEVITAHRVDVPLVPNAALRVKIDTDNDKDVKEGPAQPVTPPWDSVPVWVMKDGRPAKVWVVTGETDYINTEIVSGLAPGDEVITDVTGSAGARNGSDRDTARAKRAVRRFH
jgi:HlyD family secretion protein